MFKKLAIAFIPLLLAGCVSYHGSPYSGTNPQNQQFERGIDFPPLDYFGDLISKIHQLLFWNRHYGNHRVSAHTEQRIAEFLNYNELKDVKVRINQWAPHKEIARLITNKNIAWPYKILFFPSTLVVSTLGRPFSGLIFSDYYDPGSNTIHLFSDDVSIALHEAGHAFDFSIQKYKGSYALIRIFPGINLVQESNATEEAILYLENKGYYSELMDAPKTLYPAYSTYIASYISSSPVALVGAVGMGHWFGHLRSSDIEADLLAQKKITSRNQHG